MLVPAENLPLFLTLIQEKPIRGVIIMKPSLVPFHPDGPQKPSKEDSPSLSGYSFLGSMPKDVMYPGKEVPRISIPIESTKVPLPEVSSNLTTEKDMLGMLNVSFRATVALRGNAVSHLLKAIIKRSWVSSYARAMLSKMLLLAINPLDCQQLTSAERE